MGRRLDLQTLLEAALASVGAWLWSPLPVVPIDPDADPPTPLTPEETEAAFQAALALEVQEHVYFQPPESFKMVYPCIVYELSSGATKFADNNPYNHQKRYTVTVITKDPDSAIPDKIAMLPTCVFNRHFTSSNLHHFVYNLFY